MTNKSTPSGPSSFDLLSEFIHLRETGLSRDDAWFQVCETAGEINEITLKAFSNLAKNWERREGHKYRHHSAKTGDRTGSSPRDTQTTMDLTDAARQMQEKISSEPELRDIRSIGILDASVLAVVEQERQEKVLDHIDDLPGDAPPTQPPEGDTSPVAAYKPDYFGPRTVLLMFFKNSPQPLRVTIADDGELFIGRSTANVAMNPEIDLDRVDGAKMGVSRMHAVITRRNNQLLITDLQSVNFTHVNGIRLLPNQARTLMDGDEIWFGKLQCKIRFQQG